MVNNLNVRHHKPRDLNEFVKLLRCQRASQMTWEKVEIDNMMSWLSTLGGGFSSLGDEFQKCVSCSTL